MNDRAPTISQLGPTAEGQSPSSPKPYRLTLYEAAGFTLARILPTQARVGVIEGLRV